MEKFDKRNNRGRGRGENGEIYLKNEIAKEKIRQKKRRK